MEGGREEKYACVPFIIQCCDNGTQFFFFFFMHTTVKLINAAWGGWIDNMLITCQAHSSHTMIK